MTSPDLKISRFLHRRPWLALVGLLIAPTTWLVLVYVGALLALLITALWQVNALTGEVEMSWTLDNITEVLTGALYHSVTIRTLAIAVAVTVIDVAVAIPLGFYMAKIASRRTQQLLVVAVLLPLWASYLVKAYAWRSVLADHGIADWLLAHVGASSPGYGITATIITLSYLWLPYVVLPVYTGFNKIPDRLLEASTDLGARTVLTMRAVIGPLMVPSIVAGSVFAFSLSLGDYIAVGIVGGANQVLGNLIYTNVGAANNLPLAAAIALVPIFIIGVYLALAGRAGALGKL